MSTIGVQIEMDEHDFEQLTDTFTTWADSWGSVWEEQAEDFECQDECTDPRNHIPKSTWRFAYWIPGDSVAGLIMAKSYLRIRGFDFEVFWDTRLWENQITKQINYGRGWLLLTDFQTKRAHKSDEHRAQIEATALWGVKAPAWSDPSPTLSREFVERDVIASANTQYPLTAWHRDTPESEWHEATEDCK